MKLPAVRLASTPVFLPHVLPPDRQRHYLMVTPLALPAILPPSRARTVNQSILRLDPLHPPLVRKRTVCLETTGVHHHNHQRTLVMQRKEHYRYHQFWRKPFYGSSSEKEEYRKDLRDQLKRQIEDKVASERMQLSSKVKEAEFLREVDRLTLTTEREERIKHNNNMRLYRDENKKLMEQSWRDRVLTRSLEALRERELLRHNPINWSGTLK